MTWADVLNLVYVIGIPVLALGPSFRWLRSSEGRKTAEASEFGLKSAGGVIIWTALAASLALYSSFSRGEKLRQACRSFQEQIGTSKMSDEQLDVVTDATWWELCHPADYQAEE